MHWPKKGCCHYDIVHRRGLLLERDDYLYWSFILWDWESFGVADEAYLFEPGKLWHGVGKQLHRDMC